MPLKNIVSLWAAAALLGMTFGCASAYHAYECGCVPYGYCPEPPLPFTNYCGCPTPQAAKFHREHPTPAIESSESLPRSPAAN